MAGVLVQSRGAGAVAAAPGATAHSDLTGLTSGDDHTQYQKESERAAASGYASLDGATKVPIAQIPTGTTGSTVALGNAAAALVATHEADSSSIHGITDTTVLETTLGAQSKVDTHANDASAAHAAAAVAFTPAGSIAATDVQAAIEEAVSEAILKSVLGAKGTILTASGASTPAGQAIGTDFIDEMVPDAAAANGWKWGRTRNPLRPAAALFETFDRSTAAANQAAQTSQTLYLVAIALPTGLTVSSISFVSGTTALATGFHQIFGLYDLSLNLLRGSADDTNVAWAANALKTLALTSSFVTTYAGLHYLGILIQAGTVPSMAGKGDTAVAVPGLVPILCGTSSAAQTALPNPAAAITATAIHLYAYVS